MPFTLGAQAANRVTYLPDSVDVSDWPTLETYFIELSQRSIESGEALRQWLRDLSDLEAALSEEMGWRYIRTTCDTRDVAHQQAFQFMVAEISPKTTPYFDGFNRKLLACPFAKDLNADQYGVMLRSAANQIELYRVENIPLETQIQQKQQEYGALTGSLTVLHNGQELTLPQAQLLLKDTNRADRSEAYIKLSVARASVAPQLNALYSDLIDLRTQVAKNAGSSNFRDHKHKALDRFDYSVADVLQFHESIRLECTPMFRLLETKRKALLGVDQLLPYDLDVDPSGRPPLIPLPNEAELIERTIACFQSIRPYYGECLMAMRNMGRLDLASRVGKAPGGYQYPLYQSGLPFIFMNSVGSVRDLITLVHEGGHAVHSFLSNDLELTAQKSLTSEVAELASMSMELISFSHWEHFFDDAEQAKRAKKEHLDKVIQILPWVATIDKFQHWIYTHPGHSEAEITQAWVEIYGEFDSDVIDWTNHEAERALVWQKQHHLFEVPFYYIEYAMAQLGAIAMWRNYKADPETTLNKYDAALALGCSVPIAKVYETAGIKFDFSQEYVRGIMQFLQNEYEQLH